MSDRLRVRLLAAVTLATALGLAWPSGRSAVAATPADTLVMAKNIDDMISLDPAECYELTGVEIDSNIYDRIIRNDPHDVTKLVGGAAESWIVSPDGKTLTFKLRPTMTFASGSPVTAEDAAFSLARVIKLNKSPAFLIDQLGWTKDNVDAMVKALDPTTLQITIGPNYSPSLVLALLSSIVGSVVEKSVVMQHDQGGDLGNAWLKTHSAGGGAFTLKSWKANESVVLDANPTYREGAPPLKRVVIRHVPEAAAQRLLIEKGDADIARDLTTDQIASIASNKDVTIVRSPQATLHYVGLNVKAAPLDNPKVRLALHYLVDYDGMAGSFLKGQYQVHQTFWPSGFWAALDKNPFNFDPAKAKSLLAEAGYPNGFDITLDASNTAPYINIAQAIQANMAQGGVRVTIIPGEQKSVITKFRARQHQMLLIYWGPDYMDPHTNADSFARNTDNSDNPPTKPLAWRNSWLIPEISKMTEAAVEERDLGKREQMYKDLQQKLLDDSPFIIMFQEVKQTAERANVKNFILGPTQDVVFYGMTSK
ncbi:ABC transporter substrate-binding protein [Lichenihabitans sp. PAMC28606]|uniref:ABC transporter substrate-binding protein n=1 Tax=Lichenihabitans sp. PAMC28606 TaxID=2880932 RepID=UPI001D0A5597|nr:ABC transporter substrate-binding protein [Lichenihabitans sp. PAMC28606]UDL96172.1 ABC transporter substrate-binding protein [Lichenihabitans sp. PAMC28606]